MDFAEATIKTYSGLSTETKPTIAGGTDVPNGSRWREVDTERTYYYNLADDTWWIDGPQLDSTTHSEIVIAQAHHEMHEGDHYFFKTFLVDTAGAGSTTYFSFTTPNTTTRIHAKTSITPDVDTEISIYEDATVTGGTPLVGFNNDRDSINVAELSILAGPTPTVAGTKIWAARTGGGKNPVGVAPSSSYEIIAKRNSTYVFELIKRTTADLVADVDFWWYEHAPLI